MASPALTIHGTAIAINGQGVLLLGPSGSGKSDLALRLIDRGAMLVCDDQVMLDTSVFPPIMRQAPNIEGQMEVRGIGIIILPSLNSAELKLCVMLDEPILRMPDANPQHIINGVPIAKISLNAFEASSPIKIELALKSLIEHA